MIVFRVGITEVRIDAGDVMSENETLAKLARRYVDQITPDIPDGDLFVARQLMKDIGTGTILEHVPAEYVEGRVY